MESNSQQIRTVENITFLDYWWESLSFLSNATYSDPPEIPYRYAVKCNQVAKAAANIYIQSWPKGHNSILQQLSRFWNLFLFCIGMKTNRLECFCEAEFCHTSCFWREKFKFSVQVSVSLGWEVTSESWTSNLPNENIIKTDIILWNILALTKLHFGEHVPTSSSAHLSMKRICCSLAVINIQSWHFK